MARHAVDVKDAQAMLRMADREWANTGLIADDRGDANTNYRMMRFLDGYRGEFPDALAQGPVIRAQRAVANRRAVSLDDRAGPPLA